jgi:hypothetical protein
MILAPVLLIPKMGHEAEFVVATDASKVGIAGVLLQEDTSCSLRPCAYWARKLKGCETRYSAYDRESLAVVEVVSRVWKVFILGCKHFSMFTDHATLTHFLKQTSDKLTDRQVHWVERHQSDWPVCTDIVILFHNELLHNRTEARYVWSIFQNSTKKASAEARFGGFMYARDIIRNTFYTQKKSQRQLATRNKTF